MRIRVGKRLRFSLALTCAFCLTACDQSGDSSTLHLTNAIEIDSAAFPAVVQLMTTGEQDSHFCTGFFVNEHQVLTAAHCVVNLSPDQPELYLAVGENAKPQQKGAKALRYFLHSDFARGSQLLANPYDIAVVEFPAGSAAATVRMSMRAPRVDDSVTLVGFGRDENVAGASPNKGSTVSGTKRYGKNSIRGCEEGVFSVVGVAKTRPGLQKGQYVATAQGDSGGPLLQNAEVVGMTIASEVRQGPNGQIASVSYAIDLNSESSREFLNSVLD